ncbi:Ba26 [Baboon cytomegalovirus]|nr:Ba26 [Baboon cytomegalovirus]
MGNRQLHLVTCVLFILYCTQRIGDSYLVTTKPPFCNDCRQCTHIVTHPNETVILNSTFYYPNNADSRWYFHNQDICNMRFGTKVRNMSTIDFNCVNATLVIKLHQNTSVDEYHLLKNQSQRDYHFNVTVVPATVNISQVPLLDECANKRCTTQIKYPDHCTRRTSSTKRTTKKPTTRKTTTKSHDHKHHSTKSTTLTSPPPDIPGPIDTGGNKTILGHSISEQFQAEHLAWGGAVLGLFVLTVWALRYWLRKSKKNYKREYF